MQKSDAARIIAGLTPAETKQSSAPTSVHVMSGEVVGNSESGKVQIRMDGDVVSPDDDQIIEVDAIGGLEEGDTATILLTGQPGRAMTPMAMGSSGSVDRIVERIKTIEADYVKATEIEAEVGTFGYLKAADLEAEVAEFGYLKANELEAEVAEFGYLKADDLEAEVAEFGYLKANSATITNLQADTAKIHNLSANDISAATGYIHDLTSSNVTAQNIIADHGDFSTVKANAAKVANLTAQELEADHATIANLDTSYAQIDMANVNNAWIANGLIKDAAIKSEMVESISANQLTAGEIDADEITVRNLRASSLTVQTADGYVYVGDKRIPTKEFIDSLKDELQNEIDGAIETFTVSAVPTLNNTPANDWVVSGDAEATRKLRAKHVGDIAYVVNSSSAQNGYCYRFAYDATNQEFKWVLIKDSDVTAALSRLSTAEGKITGLETFESNTTTWMNETDEGLETIRTNHTNLAGIVDKTVVETKQLWFTKANTTAPNKPTAAVTSTSTAGNAWRVVVPAWNASYPNYYYCLQYKLADGTYAWSDVVRDIAMGESQQQGRKGVADAATADGKAVSAQNTANANIKSSVQLWFTKANSTAPDKPSAQVTTNSASTANAWNLAIPTYNSSYPHYFYCYQQQKGDGTYQWSDVVYDRSVTEAQAKAQAALPSSAFTTFQSTTFKNLVDTVEEQSSTITTMSERVDKIQIGGRNLLRGAATQDTSLGNERNSVTETTDTWLGCTVFKSSSAWADIGFRFDTQVAKRNLVVAGDTLTYSVWAKTDDTTSREIWGIWIGNASGGAHITGAKIDTLTNSWKRYEKQITVTQAMLDDATVGKSTRFECNTNCTSGKFIYWAAPKLEKGTKATDWSPAPEDVDASVKTVSTTVNSVKQTADSNRTYLTNLTTTLGTNADGTSKSEDIVHKYNQLDQTLDGTISRVGATETKLETISNPNLSPFFAMAADSVYDEDDRPTGYWKRVTTDTRFTTFLMQQEHNGSGGWAHFAGSVSSGQPFVRFEPMPIDSLKPSTEYTFVIDVDTVNVASTITQVKLNLFEGTAQSDCIDPFSSAKSFAALDKTGTFYVSGTTRADISNAAGLCRSYLQIYGTGAFDVYIRISLFEGEYSGAYKPYVDQSLSERVTQAETDIEQNATDIILRATKTEMFQIAQPNLSPFFQSVPFGVSSDNPYWVSNFSTSAFTALEDGWAHFHRNNTGTSVMNHYVRMVACPSVVDGKKYTFLVEIRNIVTNTATSHNIYTQQSTYTQFWGDSNYDGWHINNANLQEKSYYFSAIPRGVSEHSTSGAHLIYINWQVPAGTEIECDIRISLYEGDYTGPYKPYSGAQLYASQSELKITADGINSTVETLSSYKYCETGYSYSLANIKIYSAEGYIGTWSVSQDYDLRIGDTVYLNVHDATRNCDVYVKGTITAMSSATSITMASHGYEDILPVDTIKSTINQSADSVKIQANHVNIEGAAIFTGSGRLSSTSLNNAYDAKGAASAAETNAKAYTDSVEIGGRNLLKNTKNPAADHWPMPVGDGITWGGCSKLNLSFEDGIMRLVSTATSGEHFVRLNSTVYTQRVHEAMGVDLHDPLVISGYVRATIAESDSYITFRTQASNGTSWFDATILRNLITGEARRAASIPILNASSSEWVRFEVCATISESVAAVNQYFSFQQYGTFTVGDTIEFKLLKLERGNKATDWSPAPEDTVARTQRIYYRKSSTGAPTEPSAWITNGNNGENYYNQWTTKVPPIASGTGASVDKYAYLYTCEQYQMADGTLDHTTILLDENTTVIDGGKVITGSLSANSINANSGTFAEANIPNLDASKINAGDIAAARIKTNVISAINSLTAGQIDAARIKVSEISIGQSQVTNLTSDLSAKAAQSDLTTEVNQRKATYGTCSTAAGTALKVVTCANFALTKGARIAVKFTTANTTDAPKLNVNSTASDGTPIWVHNAVASSSNPIKWGANATLTFVYDGSAFVLEDKAPTYTVACSTAATTRAKAATVTGALVINGTSVTLRFSTANTYVSNSVQVNFSATGATNVYVDNAATSTTNTLLWNAGTSLTFVRQGAAWYLTERSDAAKTATTYLTDGGSNGLMVHPSNDANTGVQITDKVDIKTASKVMNRIDTSGMTLYDGNGVSDGNIVAKFASKLIELGKNAPDAIIRLCGGKLDLTYFHDTDTGIQYGSLYSQNYMRVLSGTDSPSGDAAYGSVSASQSQGHMSGGVSAGYKNGTTLKTSSLSANVAVSESETPNVSAHVYSGTTSSGTEASFKLDLSGFSINGSTPIKAIYADTTVVQLSNGKWLSLANPTVVAQKLGSGASQANTVCIAQNGGHESYTGVVTGAMGSDGSARAYIYPNHTGYIRINFILIRFT